MAQRDEQHDVAALRAMLERAPLEDVIEAVVANRDRLRDESPDELAEFEDELRVRIAEKSRGPWRDRKKAARVFRYYLDSALERGAEDGDTVTWALVRALELDPDDDALLREYVRAVADTDDRYTDLSLAEIAEKLPNAARARWLATLDAIVEYFVLRAYLTPPQPVYEAALRRSFANALARGADETSWQQARTWVLENAPFASVPDDLFARYAK